MKMSSSGNLRAWWCTLLVKRSISIIQFVFEDVNPLARIQLLLICGTRVTSKQYLLSSSYGDKCPWRQAMWTWNRPRWRFTYDPLLCLSFGLWWFSITCFSIKGPEKSVDAFCSPKKRIHDVDLHPYSSPYTVIGIRGCSYPSVETSMDSLLIRGSFSGPISPLIILKGLIVALLRLHTNPPNHRQLMCPTTLMLIFLMLSLQVQFRPSCSSSWTVILLNHWSSVHNCRGWKSGCDYVNDLFKSCDFCLFQEIAYVILTGQRSQENLSTAWKVHAWPPHLHCWHFYKNQLTLRSPLWMV